MVTNDQNLMLEHQQMFEKPASKTFFGHQDIRLLLITGKMAKFDGLIGYGPDMKDFGHFGALLNIVQP